jgi:hypothetical protein
MCSCIALCNFFVPWLRGTKNSLEEHTRHVIYHTPFTHKFFVIPWPGIRHCTINSHRMHVPGSLNVMHVQGEALEARIQSKRTVRPLVAEMRSEGEALERRLADSSTVVQKVVESVRKLDLAQTNTRKALSHTQDIIGLKTCVDDVASAIVSEDWEKAAASIQRYLNVAPEDGSTPMEEGALQSLKKNLGQLRNIVMERSVCVCVYIYTDMHACVFGFEKEFLTAAKYCCGRTMCVYTCICIYVCMHVYMYTSYVLTCICMYVWYIGVSACVYVYMHTPIHAFMHVHTRTHTYISTWVFFFLVHLRSVVTRRCVFMHLYL